MSAITAFCVIAGAARAKTRSEDDIAPGPSVITDEEKAIVVDPAKGYENAVILDEETVRNEDNPAVDWVSYHMRIKVLTNEGRSAGNVEIPYDVSRGEVSDWWGRTILPDGTVQELPQSQLQRQVVQAAGANQLVHMKAALPSVGPGCVVDFGYKYKGRGANIYRRIRLERGWPILHYRFRWTPQGGGRPKVSLRQAEKLKVSVTQDGHSYVIEGTDFPPAKEEPRMPPADESYSGAYVWYEPSDAKDFWDAQARNYDDFIEQFAPNTPKPLKEALASMKIPESADTKTRHQMIYDWLASNIRNKSLRTVEETEASAGRKDDDEKNRATYVLEKKEAFSYQFDDLFINLVRAAGGAAYSVKVPNRTRASWDTEIYLPSQLTEWVVATGDPGDPLEKLTLSDPGSGLPFGEIPWWLTGGKALLAADGKAHVIAVPVSPPDRNTAETTMQVTFGDGVVHMGWARAMTGQYGYSERRVLRQTQPEERQKRIDTMCGVSSEFDLTKAEAPGLDDLNAPMKLVCEGEYNRTGMRSELDEYGYSLHGLWMDAFEVFTSPTRRFPIVFPFAKKGHQVVDVTAPPGFGPKSPPRPVTLDSPAGSYALTVTATEKGFHVERTMILKTIRIAPEGYEAYRSFVKEVDKADGTVLMFLRLKKVES